MNNFLQEGNDFFYISPQETRHQITNMYIIANGIQDLCIVKGGLQGEFYVKRIVKASKADVVMVPLGDILWLNIDPPYMGAKSIVLDIGSDKENVKPMIKAMLKSPNAKRQAPGDLYDAYAGDDYLEES